jgi:hypothetical protein
VCSDLDVCLLHTSVYAHFYMRVHPTQIRLTVVAARERGSAFLQVTEKCDVYSLGILHAYLTVCCDCT